MDKDELWMRQGFVQQRWHGVQENHDLQNSEDRIIAELRDVHITSQVNEILHALD